MTARLVIIVVALALAGLTAVLMQSYVMGPSDTKETKQNQSLATRVLVADEDLPAGTILKPSHWRWQMWPEEALDDSYIIETDGEAVSTEFAGAAVKRAISVGEPITRKRVFKSGEAGFLAGALSPGMRAVGIQVSAVSSAAGFILPGDRVDVILTQQLRRRRQESDEPQVKVVSETILRRIRVLAIDQNVDDIEKKAKVGKTATVEVSPKQAEIVSLAARMGRLSLALRSLTPTAGEDLRTGMTRDLDISKALAGGNTLTPAASAKIEPRRRVLVADRDLDAGALLRDTNLRWAQATGDAVGPDFFVEGRSDRARLRGAVMRRPISAGQPLLANAIMTSKTPGFLAAVLRPGMRAVTMGRASVAGVSEFAAPGDRVDVVLTRKLPGTNGSATRHTSDAIIQNIRILALDSKRGTAALEVTSKQAAMLAVVGKVGEITLSLRGDESPEGDSSTTQAGAATYLSLFGNAKGKTFATAVKSSPAAPAAARVLVANRNIPAGTLLRDNDLSWRTPESGSSGKAAFVEGRDKRATLRGALIKRSIGSGEPLTAEAIIKPGTPGFLAAALAPDNRAISIGVNAVSGVSGFVTPDDRVDIILTQKIRSPDRNKVGPSLDPRRFSETVLKNVRVLAIVQTVDPNSGQPVAGKTATLEVSAKQAEVVALAATMGRLSLSLRRPQSTTADVGGAFTSDLAVSAAALHFLSGGPIDDPPPAETDVTTTPPVQPQPRGRTEVRLYRGAVPVEHIFD